MVLFIPNLKPDVSRNTELFGEDAHVFNPDRWFRENEKKGPTLGVYGNLYVHSTIGFVLPI